MRRRTKLVKSPFVWFDHRTDLPKWLLAGIGQILVEWSVLERELEELIRRLMDVDIKIGRIVANDLRARPRITVATNLIEAYVQDGTVSPDFFDEFVKLGSQINEKLQARRDKVAHCLWDKSGDDWYVLRMKARRPTPAGLKKYLNQLSRAVIPQPELIDQKALAQIATDIVGYAKRIEDFYARIDRALPAPKNEAPPYRRRRPRPSKSKVP
jgi:hypothetical protein